MHLQVAQAASATLKTGTQEGALAGASAVPALPAQPIPQAASAAAGVKTGGRASRSAAGANGGWLAGFACCLIIYVAHSAYVSLHFC